MAERRLPHVAIVGRPNVGKSTLFNRIVGGREAIVGRQSGMTRDRHRAEAEWRGRRFLLVDTGGVEWGSADELLAAIQKQAFRAVEEADIVLFVVDGRAGIVSVESRLATEIRKRGMDAFLVVNKCDAPESAEMQASEFYELGLSPVYPTSAEHGTGVADLLDGIIDALPGAPEAEDAERESGDRGQGSGTRVAVVGRPNVGKSSLVNALLGAQRVIVSARAGTTRDAIDTHLEQDGRAYVVIDTAGIRREAKQEGFADWVAVIQARRRMQRADVALLVIDATAGLGRQDLSIGREAAEAGCGLVVVVNKWDLVDHEGAPTLAWLEELRARMGRLSFAAFAFVSARTGAGIEGLLPLVEQVEANRVRRVPTGELNAMFEQVMERGMEPPPGAPRPKYLTQVRVAPPTFVVFVGGKGGLPDTYRRYIENRLRESFDFTGCPVRVRVRKGRRSA